MAPPARGRKPKHTCSTYTLSDSAAVSKKPKSTDRHPLLPEARIPGSRALPGLRNFGSTCYLNACLSVLPALRPLHPFLFRPQHSHVCTSRTASQCFLCALHHFGTAYMSGNWTLANRTLDSGVSFVAETTPTVSKKPNARRTRCADFDPRPHFYLRARR